MGVLDALTILGAGIGRGYRGSQELQRQIAEQKRKALLEEREQAVSEQNSASQRALQEAQIQTEALNRAIGQFGLDVNKKKFETSQTPVTQGNAPLKLHMLGQDVNLPGNVQSLTDNPDILKELLTQDFQNKHPQFYTNYPPAGTAAAQIRNSPESRGRDYIHAILGMNLTPLPGEDSDAYTTRMAQERAAKLRFLMDTDPDAINTFLQKAGADSTDDTEGDDGDLDLDKPAIKPLSNKAKAKNNRFKGVKIKS